jgi:hypothetical protein
LPGLVRPVPVVAPQVLGQGLTEMPLAEDQYVVQALAAEGPDDAFTDGCGSLE